MNLPSSSWHRVATHHDRVSANISVVQHLCALISRSTPTTVFWHAEPCNHGARLVKQASRLLVLGCVRRLVLLPGTKMMEDITMALRSAIEIRLSRMCSQRPAEAPVRSAQALQHYVGYYEEPCLYTVERDGRKVKSPWSSRLESFFRHADL